MPDIFYMFVCIALVLFFAVFALILHLLAMSKKQADKAILGAAVYYLLERFKK